MSSNQDVDKGKPSSSSTSGNQSTPRPGARALLTRHFLGSLGNSPGRLSSLRPPRDLTLGASALQTNTPKRTFTPNIPSRRIKEEPKDDSVRKEKPAKVVTDKERGRRRGRDGQDSRGRGNSYRSKPEIIQSPSVFSMGPANKVRAGLSTPSVGLGGARSGESKGTPGAIKKEKYNKYDDEESKRVLQMLQGDGDIEEDKSMQEAGLAPIHLPLAQHSLKLKEGQSQDDQVTGINIKAEPMDVDIDEKETKKKFIKPIKHVPVKTKGRESPVSCASLFSPEVSSEETQLLFMQFPDVLPISTATPDTGEPMNTDQPGTSDRNPASKSKDAAKPNLKDVSEGYIGKLQILKSGKARLVLGNVVLDVAIGSPCGFLQDLVAIHTENNRSDMVVLGHVKHRLVCTPDFERLLMS